MSFLSLLHNLLYYWLFFNPCCADAFANLIKYPHKKPTTRAFEKKKKQKHHTHTYIQQHEFTIMPTHSRTSSSASSVGSSYVSSTDSNKTSHIESPTPFQTQPLELSNNSNFHVLNCSSTLPSYQNVHKLINDHHHNQNGNKHNDNNNNNEHEDGSDNDQIDFNDMHHESSITCNKLATIDQTVHEINDKPTDSIYIIKQSIEQIGCGENFAYKTLNGDVIRSVHPPGKGKPINYKVSVGLDCCHCFIFI